MMVLFVFLLLSSSWTSTAAISVIQTTATKNTAPTTSRGTIITPASTKGTTTTRDTTTTPESNTSNTTTADTTTTARDIIITPDSTASNATTATPHTITITNAVTTTSATSTNPDTVKNTVTPTNSTGIISSSPSAQSLNVTSTATFGDANTTAESPTTEEALGNQTEWIEYQVNMSASFIHELEELDDYMINETDLKFKSVCRQSNQSLPFCGVINYPLPKALSLAPLFQDSLAQTAVDTLSILTKGKTTSCEEQLKKIYCLQKFPSCDDYKEEMKWEKNTTERCFELIDECPEDAKETMKRMQVCEKLSKGQFKIEECVPPMPPSNEEDLCNPGNVSAWLYHSSVEINSLLQFQFSLNEQLSDNCRTNLTSFLCSTGQQCFVDDNSSIQDYLVDVKTRCKSTLLSCENDELNRAIKELFLDCTKYHR